MSYPGDNPVCGDYSHLCGMIFAPDRGCNDCKTEGGMCCDIPRQLPHSERQQILAGQEGEGRL